MKNSGIMLLALTFSAAVLTGCLSAAHGPDSDVTRETVIITDSARIGTFIESFGEEINRPPDGAGFREEEWGLFDDGTAAVSIETAHNPDGTLVFSFENNRSGEYMERETGAESPGLRNISDGIIHCGFDLGDLQGEVNYADFSLILYQGENDHTGIKVDSEKRLSLWHNIDGKHIPVAEIPFDDGIIQDGVNSIKLFGRGTSMAVSINDRYLIRIDDPLLPIGGNIALRAGTNSDHATLRSPYLVIWKL